MSVYNSVHTGALLDTAINDYLNQAQVTSIANAAVDAARPYFLINTTVAIADWVADNTYTAYPYKATILDNRITSNTYCEVVFNLADATSGYFAPICNSLAGGLEIYASSVPLAAITIPTIKCTENIVISS